MTPYCQWLIVIGLAWRCVANLYYVHAGRPRIEPSGFIGTFVTIVFMACAFAINWKAGAFSTLIGTP